MILSLLFQSPVLFFIWIFAVLIAFSVHEFCHGAVALALGDTTAKDQGRLTLNPLAHIDPLGFLLLIIIGFGWGKPVPYNPYNVRYPKLGPVLIGLAGPASNFLMAALWGGAIVISRSNGISSDNLLVQFAYLSLILNLMLMVFNLIPLPPLDGSKVLLPFLRTESSRIWLETRGPWLLFLLIILDRFTPFSILSSLFEATLNFADRLVH